MDKLLICAAILALSLCCYGQQQNRFRSQYVEYMYERFCRDRNGQPMCQADGTACEARRICPFGGQCFTIPECIQFPNGNPLKQGDCGPPNPWNSHNQIECNGDHGCAGNYLCCHVTFGSRCEPPRF